MLLTLVTLSLLADIAPGPFEPKRRPPAQCSADTDCVLSNVSCCPGCCVGPPHAVRRGVDEAAQCPEKECAMPNCAAVRCAKPPEPGAFVAQCQSGRCVSVPREEPAPVQCRVNQDCTVVNAVPPAGASCHQSACGCCPVTQAVPVDAVVPLQKKPKDTKAPPNGGKPNFGLSTGGPPPPAAPNCAACPAPTGGTAACSAGRCVLQELPRPRPMPPG